MLFRFLYLNLFFLFIFSTRLSAQTGCYVSSSTTFAPNSIGTAGPSGAQRPTYTGSLALQTSTTCPRVKTFTNNRGANTCYIRTGTTSSNYVYTSGSLYDYQPENCPLDDYIWVLIVAIGGVGFITVRKSRLT